MKILAAFIFVTWYISCKMDASFDVSGPILFPFRQNDILFVVSETCSEADFNNLYNLWKKLDDLPIFDYSPPSYFVESVNKNVYLSDQFNISYVNSACPSEISIDEFFNESLTKDVKAVAKNFILEHGIQKSCPPSGTTIQTIIFSDTCLLTELATINQQPTYECPFDYQNYVLYMPTDAAVIACQNSYGEVKDKLHIFRADNLTNDAFKPIRDLYTSSDVWFYCNLYSTTFNAFSVNTDSTYYTIIYDYIIDKFINTQECNHGGFAGHFQYHYGNLNEYQETDIRILPIDRCGTIRALERNLKQYSYSVLYPNDNSTNCDFIINNLNKILNFEIDVVQYNVLFMDAYPSCLKNLKWTKKNRHLDIYVFGQEEHASTYLSFIDGNSTLSNHVTFITKDNAQEILAMDTVCKSSVPSVTFNETTVTEATDLSTTATTFTTDIILTDTTTTDAITATTSESMFTTSIMSTTMLTESTLTVDDVSANTTQDMHTTIDTTFLTTQTFQDIATTQLLHKKSSIWYIIIITMFILLGIIIGVIIIIARKKLSKRKYLSALNIVASENALSAIETLLSQEKRIRMKIPTPDVLIDFETVLGKGSYSTVFKAIIKKPHKDISAAIKIPLDFNDEKAELLIQELDALIKMGSHPYITTFLGWSMYGGTPGILTELSETNLLDYVKALEGQELNHDSLYLILWQISTALEHLALLKIIHRDVACRNVLLTSKTVAKLADFGLSCFCDDSDTYQVADEKTKFPLRWLSIEALVDKIFSEKSDVWAFAILCYEMYTFGATPYVSMSHSEVLKFLQAGNRLHKPQELPLELYSLMMKCWSFDPAERPNFSLVCQTLFEIQERSFKTCE